MANLYILLDATHPDYSSLVANLKAEVNSNFTPRLSLDETKSLIQVKDSYLSATVDTRQALGPFVLGTGDEAWARTQVSGQEWEIEE